MSWFKRTNARPDMAQGRGSRASPDKGPSPGGGETDPDTCLEVFKNHWQQVLQVMTRNHGNKDGFTMEDVDTVVHNFEQMVTLLVVEEGDGGMPGPILHFLLEQDVLQKFCSWCHGNAEMQERLRYDQLRLFELMTSQAKQLLLIHKPVIRPLLMLLTACSEMHMSQSSEVEHRLVQVLHQICVCISQQTIILESFFCTKADHGPARFLIFSLLIPYIHREGPVGQNARDALLLLMALSGKHPYIGQYIAEKSDFCPVLATGLSGLYSSLPRKFSPPSEEWYMFTAEDCTRIPDLQLFLNSLEFCNAVVQVSHVMVREQLIKFIYDGFLVPVLGPALHQDISGLPIPLLDTVMFGNSREEVLTATAYLDLFLRSITEPALIKAFLKFILTEKYDEIVILESLVTRVNSQTKLSLISLSLFKTLLELNCEDVMFQLVFKYLIPCTHVMVSQRRSVKDLDLYSKSAEKFLSLRPSCIARVREGVRSSPATPRPVERRSSISIGASPTPSPRPSHFPKVFRRNSRVKRSASFAQPSSGTPEATRKSPEPAGMAELKDFESSYIEYLKEARLTLNKCAAACSRWSAPYNGDVPPPDSNVDGTEEEEGKPVAVSRPSDPLPSSSEDSSSSSQGVKFLSHGNAADCSARVSPDRTLTTDSSPSGESARPVQVLVSGERSRSPRESPGRLSLDPGQVALLHSSLGDLDSFLAYLAALDSPMAAASSLEETAQFLESMEQLLLSQISSGSTGSAGVVAGDGVTGSSSDASGHLGGGDGVGSLRGGSHAPKTLSINLGAPRRTSDSTPTPTTPSSSRAVAPKYSNKPPNIGPFLSALFGKLESMMGNSLYMNLLLTGIIARLAAYPHPLLRSFLLNHNLVFQPSVKSLFQVLSVVRQKLDSYAWAVPGFDRLLLHARKNLLDREDLLLSNAGEGGPLPPILPQQLAVSPPRPQPVSDVLKKERRKPSLADLLFRRPGQSRGPGGLGSPGARGGARLQQIRTPGGTISYHFVNRAQEEAAGENPEQSLKTWNAVYCAVVLDEFLKELASLAQEHALLKVDEGYNSS